MSTTCFTRRKDSKNRSKYYCGAQDYSSMKPYIDIVDDIKATSMTKFNGLLEINN